MSVLTAEKYRSFVTPVNPGLDVSCPHVVFTIDKRLRRSFKKDRLLLNVLFEAAKDTIFYVPVGHIWNTLTIGYHHQDFPHRKSIVFNSK